MNLLIINAGSTTIKFKLFNEKLIPQLEGMIDKKADDYSFSLKKDGNKYEWSINEENYYQAPELILKELQGYSIDKLAFRIVHGGERFRTPTLLTEGIINELEKLNNLAPLHNPPAIQKIKEFRKLLPLIRFYAVFDTAFHNSIPVKAALYALPYELYEQDKIKRYGFHGISHKFVVSELIKLEPTALKVITCHLGGGSSMTAVQNNKSIDTSMGFTPEEGLIMATRPGDVDDGVIQYLISQKQMTIEQIQAMENDQSGLLGISGITSDMRKLLDMEKQNNERAHLAIEMYIYRVQKYIGAYTAALGGLDALVFTAGVGAGSDVIRKRICEQLGYLNLYLDDSINNGKINVSQNLKISAKNSVPVWVIPTDEELQIAREVMNL